MNTKHVPVSQWRTTLDELSRTYEGMPVSLEVVGGDVGAEEEVCDQPLRGITFDSTGVNVMIEKRGGIHLDHRVPRPQILRVVETDEGAVLAVEIEADKGMYSLVSFRSPIRPEVLDRPAE